MEQPLLYSSSLLLLLLLLSSQALRSTDGSRALRYQLKALPPGGTPEIGEGVAMAEAVIGSRPPRCEGKCAPCGRCEAVQVPVAPRVDSTRRGGAGADADAEAGGRAGLVAGEASYTDYKPLNWKCRCADRRALDP